MAGLYVHIPFCKQACHYCDFHFSTQLSQVDRMVRGLCSEIEMRQSQFPKTLQSIYFGGGTPSLLDSYHLDQIFESISQVSSYANNIEITLEANPDDVNIEKLNQWKAAGINRLSLGIQSFDDEDLKKMNRAHTSAEAKDCISKAVQEGFSNFTIDMIYGLPWSTNEKWKKNLRMALDLPVHHLSAYCLTIEGKTVFSHLLSQNKMQPLSNREESEQYSILQNTAMEFGFQQYEVSNFCREGQRAVHNSSYWNNADCLAIGPGAHGLLGKTRYFNTPNNNIYIKDIEQGNLSEQTEVLSAKDQYNEVVMTGIRTVDGIDKQTIEKFDDKLQKHFWKEIKRSNLKNHIDVENGRIKLIPPEGFHFADAIARDLFYTASS